MTRTISLITATVGAVLLFAVPAWGDSWGADQDGQSVGYLNPDAADRAITAERSRLLAMLDAREQSLGAGVGNGKVSALDARERSFAAKQDPQLVAAQVPDWFERAAATAIRDDRTPAVDDPFTIDPTSAPNPVTVSPGREIEWPQVGIGLGIGLLLALGLFLGMRHMRIRPLAH